jgi:hypothetical protein
MPKTKTKARKSIPAPPPPRKKARLHKPSHAVPRRRDAMTDQAQQEHSKPNMPPSPPREQRGAGSGAKATVTRERSIIDWPPPLKTHSEHVAELEAEAEAQAEYNTKIADMLIVNAERMIDIIGFPQTPEDNDAVREESLAVAQAELDPKAKEAALKNEMAAREKREKAAAPKAS